MLVGLLLTLSLAAPVAQNSDAALERGLAAIQATRYRADLEFLADDLFRGRETPSPELRLAALFLRARVQSLGFQPGAPGGWFQDYPLHTRRLDSTGSFLQARTAAGQVPFQFGKDYFFQLPSHAFDHELDAGVICVGDGSKADLEGLELAGYWALVLDRGKLHRKTAQRCFAAGALGVLFTPGANYTRKSYPEKYLDRAERMLEASAPSPTPPKAADGEGPVVMLERSAGQRLFESLSTQLDGDGFPPLGARLPFELHEQRAIIRGQQMVSNLCAFWPGSDPALAGETMVISAHYDHVGVRKGEIYNGADDNASGTSGLLALADALVAYGPMRRSVLLLWVSGEEKGLWGSKAWVDAPWLPNASKPVLNINIDMIGRAGETELFITPTPDHASFNPVAKAGYDLAGLEQFGGLLGMDEFWRSSDHMNFDVTLGIPVVFLSAGDHEDYHKPTDTADKIQVEKSARIVRVVLRMLHTLQQADLSSPE